MEVFVRDHALNISEKYLKPGFAFGGSCLPKDLRAIESMSSKCKIDLPLLRSILPSNENHIRRVSELILKNTNGPLGFAGLTYKSGTDDLRESPIIRLISFLYPTGRTIITYDASITPRKFLGANLDVWNTFMNTVNPIHLDNPEKLIEMAENIVCFGPQKEVMQSMRKCETPTKVVIDLTGDSKDMMQCKKYFNICGFV
jgi:GDP-mannose 6-dehydrogenase